MTDFDRRWQGYADKMAAMIDAGADLANAARFVDVLAPRGSMILDVGCGHGSDVAALRAAGHVAFGIDPVPAVLDVARSRYSPGWYAGLDATDLSASALAAAGFPGQYQAVLLAGNVPAFLPEGSLTGVVRSIAALLTPGGLLVVGTTAGFRGGPAELDPAAAAAGLSLTHRLADWRLAPYQAGSLWSVSVFGAPGVLARPNNNDGTFVVTAV